jgi:phasin family protein
MQVNPARRGRRIVDLSTEKESQMTAKPEDFLVQAWKQQLDIGLRLIETMVEGATKLREVQIEAAADAHADAAATRKSIAAATEAEELLKLQTGWARANAEKCSAYWRALYEVAAQTQGELARCLCAQAPVIPGDDESSKALLSVIDNTYKQWLDATQQFYKLPAIPAGAAVSERRAAA